MDENELEQFVTDKLVMANSERDNIPDLSMLCCRKALEKISIYLHIKFIGEKPEEVRSQSIKLLEPELKPGSYKLMKHIWGKSSSYLHEKDPPVTPSPEHVTELIGEIERLYLSEIGVQLHWEPISVGPEDILEEIMENVREENILESKEGLNNLLQSLRSAGVLSQSTPKFSLEHLLALGNAAYLVRNYELSESYYEKAQQEASLTGDRGAEAKALTSLGAIAKSFRGDIGMSRRLQEAALRIARESGDSYAEGIALLNLAGDALDEGQFNVAEHLIGQANKKLGGTNRELTDGYKPDFDAEIYLLLGNIAWRRAHNPEWSLMGTDYHMEEAQLNWREYVRIRNQYGLKLQDWFYKHGWTDPDGDWDFPPDES